MPEQKQKNTKPLWSHDIVSIKKELINYRKKDKKREKFLANIPAIYYWVVKWPAISIPAPFFGSVKIDLLTTIRNHVRKWYLDELFEPVVMSWIDIETLDKDSATDRFDYLRSRFFLDHLPKEQFIKDLLHKLDEFYHDDQHSLLKNWLQSRIAFLQFFAEPHSTKRSTEYENILINSSILRLRYHHIVATLCCQKSGKYDALKRDTERVLLGLMDNALNSAGECVLCGLGKKKLELNNDSTESKNNNSEKYTLDVNLMLPVSSDYIDIADTSSKTIDQLKNDFYHVEINTKNSESIWGDKSNYSTVLKIVKQTAETDKQIPSTEINRDDTAARYNENKKEGFWVPLNDELFGAPRAFKNLTGSCVIREDLPDKNHLNDVMNGNWVDFISNYAHDEGFISIPCVVPDTNNYSTNASSHTVAVLNVNIHSADEYLMYRGYHPCWNNYACELSRDFIIEAFHYYQLLTMLDPKQYNAIVNTNCVLWNSYNKLSSKTPVKPDSWLNKIMPSPKEERPN